MANIQSVNAKTDTPLLLPPLIVTLLKFALILMSAVELTFALNMQDALIVEADMIASACQV